ncbi:MAG: hypothetical protein ACLQOO_04480 [Terriglobia bacterium]
MIRTLLRALMLWAVVSALGVSSSAQVQAPGSGGALTIMQRIWTIAGKVRTLQGDPVRGAKVNVKLTNVMGQAQALETDFQGEFRTEFKLSADQVKELAVELTASKPGFLTAHEIVDSEVSGDSIRISQIAVTLREAKDDPNLLSQSALVSDLAPRLKKLEASDGLSTSAQKDYLRGVGELLDQQQPDRALPFLTKVARKDASCVGCRTMLGLAELDSGNWDGAQRDFTDGIKASLADRTRGRSEPFDALGVMESWQGEPKKAAGLFLEALKFAPQDPLALQELGRSQFLLRNWDSASAYFAQAIDAGASPELRLLRVEALLGEGDAGEANKEITLYLAGRDVRTMPAHVRQLWVQVQERQKQADIETVNSVVDEPVNELVSAMPELKGLDAATDQGQLDSLLAGVGKNVASFFRNFPNTVSEEQVHEELLHRSGKPGAGLDQKFRYLLMAQPAAGGLGLEEYRTDSAGNPTGPAGKEAGLMITKGFASLSMIFHPDYQPESVFRYLGAQTIDGHQAEVVAFAQRPKIARMTESFRTTKDSVVILIQGLAWIDPESYQILRLRTDLLEPQTRIRLKRQTTEVAYSPITFTQGRLTLWLPVQVTVTVSLENHTFRNQHVYSDFKLFSVETHEQHGQPGASSPL